MYCPSCGTQFEAAVKFCPSCGAAQVAQAPQQPAAQSPQSPQQTALPESGPMSELQAKLGAVPALGTIQQRLNSLQVPAIPVGAGAPPAAGPDLIWSAALAVGALISIWFMRWYMIPIFLAAGALAIIYGVRPGVSVVTRSVMFILAGVAGNLGVALGDIGDIGAIGAIILMIVTGRGVWGLLKEGLPGGNGVRLEGKRYTVLIVGLVVCLLATFFQWDSVRSYANIDWIRKGTIYTDGSGRTVHDGTWMSPEVSWSFYGGENGSQALPWLLGAGILLLVFRSKPWPQWVRWALTVCLTFMLITAIQGLGQYLGLGVLLFLGGYGAIAWSLLTRKA